ncbi:MAG: TylF/MycF/NovP-related O-methyltransferase [Bacteroidota bacterium]
MKNKFDEKMSLITDERLNDNAEKFVEDMIDQDQDVFVRVQPEKLFESPVNLKIANYRYPGLKKYVLTDCHTLPDRISDLGKIIFSIDEIPVEEIPHSLIFIFFTCDSDALPVLRKIKEYGGKYMPHQDSSKTDYRFVNRMAYNAIQKTWGKTDRISHMTMIVHENLCEALELTKNIPGDFVEIGVFLGGSSLTALNFLHEQSQLSKVPSRKAWLMDTFDGFNYQEAKNSQDVIWQGTHKLFGVGETMKYITETLTDAGAPFELIEGNICSEELPGAIDRISVANIDVDMYDPTLSALNKCAERLSDGGIIIAEDPTSTPLLYGAYLAMNEFLESPIGKSFTPIFKKGQYFLLKNNIPTND